MLLARLAREDSIMQPVADYQAQYIAIVAMLRSIGQVFDKVDSRLGGHLAWSRERWKVWKQDPIFADFIEPTRDALLKEFEGGLELRGEAFGAPAVVVDVTAPGGTSLLVSFEPKKACDLRGRPVLPLFHAAMTFWDRCLSEAEAEFAKGR
ncbi:MAG: hypothetical protein AB1942_00080 [Pseudomonadota bacterium]